MQNKIDKIETFVLDFIKKNPERCQVGQKLCVPVNFFARYDNQEKNAAIEDMKQKGWIEIDPLDEENILLTKAGFDAANKK